MLPSRSFPRAILTAGLLFIAQSGISVAADFPELSLPIDCKLGEDCWLINYFDHAPEKAILDYTGGTNLYDEHKGIDIAIPDIKTMIQGVNVLAVADGIVLAIRDHIPDIGSIDRDGRRIDFPKCGNAVLLDHGNDLRTQYCHMRRGSISVDVGDKVKRGHKIGLVGLSGFTNFPHIHLAVSLGEDKVDPFVGPGWKPDQGETPRPMWTEDVRKAAVYQPFVLQDAGFTGGSFSKHGLLQGWYSNTQIPATSHELTFGVLAYFVDPGDEMVLEIKDPGGKDLTRETVVFDADIQRHWRSISVARPKEGWRSGTYTGFVSLKRNSGTQPEEQKLIRSIKIDQ